MTKTIIYIATYFFIGILIAQNFYMVTRKRKNWIIFFWPVLYLAAVVALLFANKKEKN